MSIPELKVGDVILAGKYRNRRATITGFSKDSNHQPVVQTDKGDFPVFHFRLEKLMPGESMSKAQELLDLFNEADEVQNRVDYEQKELAPIRKQINDLHNKRKDFDLAAHDASDPEKKKQLKAQSDKLSAEIEKLGQKRADKQAQLDAEWKSISKRKSNARARKAGVPV